MYAPDFFPVIESYFSNGNATYDDVQLKLANYQIDLEPVNDRTEGGTYFVSRYDLQGDGETSIVFFFDGNYANNNIDRIIYNYGYDAGF